MLKELVRHFDNQKFSKSNGDTLNITGSAMEIPGILKSKIKLGSYQEGDGNFYYLFADLKFNSIQFHDLLQTISPDVFNPGRTGVISDWVDGPINPKLKNLHQKLGESWEIFLSHIEPFINTEKPTYKEGSNGDFISTSIIGNMLRRRRKGEGFNPNIGLAKTLIHSSRAHMQTLRDTGKTTIEQPEDVDSFSEDIYGLLVTLKHDDIIEISFEGRVLSRERIFESKDANIANDDIAYEHINHNDSLYPILVWKVDPNGKREFVLDREIPQGVLDGIGVRDASKPLDTLLGFLLATYFAPESRQSWPISMEITNENGEKQEQTMGPAQVPVLALMYKNDIMRNSRLVAGVERLLSE